MEILTEKTTVSALKSMAEKLFGNLVKAVVDVRPSQRNSSRRVGDAQTREKILVVQEWIS